MPDAIGCVAIHATAVIIRASGILLRGRSGAGKSSVALALLDRAEGAGWFGRLVGDDRILVQAVHGRLIVRPHASIAGRIERRGSGILEVPFRSSAVARLVVDLDGACDLSPRMPEPGAMRTCICGIELPRIQLSHGNEPGAVAEVVRKLLQVDGLG